MNKECVICNSESKLLMNDLILGKHRINYYVCKNCKCIFTEEPYWLDEAYNDAITITDTGIMARNILICDELTIILNKYFDANIKIVDFGGGYGILTRMLRDRGFDVLWHDKYSKNLLSRGFEYDGETKVDLILAFEVLEHLSNPLEVFTELMSKTNCLIFSTVFLEKIDHKSNKDWWYFTPESGQHIFFSSEQTMTKIAKLLDCHYLKINELHILHKSNTIKSINNCTKLKILTLKACYKLINIITYGKVFHSKTVDDYKYLKSMINNHKLDNL